MAVKGRTTSRHPAELPPMTLEELREYLDAETRKYLGMSGDEFIERWQRRELPDTAATFDLGIIAHFLEHAGDPDATA